jgi:protein-L-isoaspartate(D-aspartate) O-methyltransferase
VTDNSFEQQRQNMVDTQIKGRGVQDKLVLQAMQTIPREKFVPDEYHNQAYEDYPLPIGYSQTISQPYIVAYMTEILNLDSSETVLEIGTGSGYQAAVLSKCAEQVYTIEIVEPLCEESRHVLDSMGFENVHVRCGDGYQGWPEHAPFDAIIVTAAPPDVPEALVEQLANGGRLVIPVGKYVQNLMLITKNEYGAVNEEKLIPVRFVPMTGGE